jgi:hypothetical protein
VYSAFNNYNIPIATISFNGTEESLCVTSDSKVGVGIANPQRALEVAGDLVVSGTISGGAGLGSFRNRIINGDMRIAQRGTSNVISTGAGAQYYMIDRFAFNSNFSAPGQLTQTQQTLTASDTPYQAGFRYSWRITTNTALTAASYGYIEPQHIIEGYNVADLNWGTSFGSPITVSFWFRTNLAPGLIVSATIRGGAQYAFPFAVTGNGTWQYVTATVPPPPNGGTWGGGNGGGIYLFLGARGLNSYQNPPNTWIATNYSGTSLDCNPYALAGNYVEFTGVQLEKGTVATGFEQRPFAQELALCQRYYQLYNTSGSSGVGGILGIGSVNSSTSVIFAIPLRVDMRVAPTSMTSNATVGSNYLVVQAGGSSSVTAITLVTGQTSSQMAWVQTTSTSGLTAGGAAIMYGGGVYGTLGFNAEL